MKLGHTVFFAGMKSDYNERSVFSKIYQIDWTPRARRGFPFYWHGVRKQLDRVIKEARPDIVHAHNIFSAKMISQFGIPFVYDDHEYWPSYVKTQAESGFGRNPISKSCSLATVPRRIARRITQSILNRNSVRLGLKWEKELIKSTPTITVSDRIARELIKLGSTRTFVTPNFPMRTEINGILEPVFHDEVSCVYTGSEPKNGAKVSHRNMDGLGALFSNEDLGILTLMGTENRSSEKIKCKSFLTRQAMYQEMLNHSIGLIPFKKHWSHPYISPNKAYEYAHAGLVVMCTSSLESVTLILKDHCATFENYDEMALKIKHMREDVNEVYNRRQKIFNFARDNLVWENHEKNILRAYQLC